MDFYEDGQLRCYYLLRPALVAALIGFLEGAYPVIKRDREDVRREGRLRERARGEQAACEA